MNRLPLITMETNFKYIYELYMDLLKDVLEVSEYGKNIINYPNTLSVIHMYQELVTNAIGRCSEARIDMDEFRKKCNGIITSALKQSEQFTDIESHDGTNDSIGPQITDEQSFSIQAATETIYGYFSKCSELITTVETLGKKLTHITEKIKQFFTPGLSMYLHVPILVGDTRKLLEYFWSLPQVQPGYPLQNQIVPGLQQPSGIVPGLQQPSGIVPGLQQPSGAAAYSQQSNAPNQSANYAQSQNPQVNPLYQPMPP